MINYSVERFENRVNIRDFIDLCVDVDYFLELCKKCPNYGKNHMCPPFKFQPLDLWKRFRQIHLIGLKITVDPSVQYEDATKASAEIIKIEKDKLVKEFLEKEKEIKGSVSCFAGRCTLCDVCARVEGKPCRIPSDARHSIESLGANVSIVAEKYLGLKILWIKDNKMPEYLTLVAGMLIPYI